MSSASQAAKAAKLIADRLAIMREVRSTNIRKFKATVDQMIHANEFARGECIVSTIAKGVARSFGLSPNVVEIVPMHNNWASAEFMHTVFTPMPPPQAKGEKIQPPVKTVTVFKVIKASGKIKLSVSIFPLQRLKPTWKMISIKEKPKEQKKAQLVEAQALSSCVSTFNGNKMEKGNTAGRSTVKQENLIQLHNRFGALGSRAETCH
ncbi:unnamed protein product [Eruca vesicaria subsp. sativa]|uniref:Uncharacterized protein n=1 Tax=Eruca vesicaria subsp. sativa TaxID=29727 RepID=A0ABC8LB71_ERUVS|nr:unnamed protein product [Eruca vesicaria subsp. sativa]